MKTVTRQRAVENHPLNARLVFEELFIGYRDVFATDLRISSSLSFDP